MLAPLPLAGLLCCLLAPLPLARAGLLNLPRPCFLGWNVLHHQEVVPHRTYAHPNDPIEQRRRLVHPRLLRGQEPLLSGARRQRQQHRPEPPGAERFPLRRRWRQRWLCGAVGGGCCHPHPAMGKKPHSAPRLHPRSTLGFEAFCLKLAGCLRQNLNTNAGKCPSANPSVAAFAWNRLEVRRPNPAQGAQAVGIAAAQGAHCAAQAVAQRHQLRDSNREIDAFAASFAC